MWEDPWIQGFSPKPRDETQQLDFLRVADLFDETGRAWDVQKLHATFDDASIEAILKIPIPMFQKEDKLVRVLDRKGVFSMRSAYGANQSIHFDDTDKNIWIGIRKAKIHEQLKIFLWRIANNALPTKFRLAPFL